MSKKPNYLDRITFYEADDDGVGSMRIAVPLTDERVDIPCTMSELVGLAIRIMGIAQGEIESREV